MAAASIDWAAAGENVMASNSASLRMRLLGEAEWPLRRGGFTASAVGCGVDCSVRSWDILTDPSRDARSPLARRGQRSCQSVRVVFPIGSVPLKVREQIGRAA